ncbi:MAG: hypothetical protein MUE81_01045 [Thermoflexibacter sp.]|nr:hypothetical protein [Thermoflexibacter sp.]
MIALVSINTGCKNKQKEAEKKAAAERAAKIAQAKTDLQALLADNNKSPEELEKDLARIKAMGLDDPEVRNLVKQVEEKISKKKAEIAEAKRKAEEEERRRKEEEERQKPAKLSLNDYFSRIIASNNANEANNYITEALKLFASPETPVLIAIGVFGGEKDYDKPTTIKKYLEYLKDQKKNLNNIENIAYDNNGKIKELELMRKK